MTSAVARGVRQKWLGRRVVAATENPTQSKGVKARVEPIQKAKSNKHSAWDAKQRSSTYWASALYSYGANAMTQSDQLWDNIDIDDLCVCVSS